MTSVSSIVSVYIELRGQHVFPISITSINSPIQSSTSSQMSSSSSSTPVPLHTPQTSKDPGQSQSLLPLHTPDSSNSTKPPHELSHVVSSSGSNVQS